MTAEFVILIPLAVGLVVTVLALIGVQVEISNTAAEMASIARAVEAGPNAESWRQLAAKFGVAASSSPKGDLLCLALKKNLSVLGLGQLPVAQTICALPIGH